MSLPGKLSGLFHGVFADPFVYGGLHTESQARIRTAPSVRAAMRILSPIVDPEWVFFTATIDSIPSACHDGLPGRRTHLVPDESLRQILQVCVRFPAATQVNGFVW